MKKVMLILGFMANVLSLTGCQSNNDMQTKETSVSSSVPQYTQTSSVPNVQFSDEELVSAFYLDSFIDGNEKKTIEDSYHWLTQEHPGEVHFNKVDDEYIMDYSTKGSRLHFKIKENTIEKFGEYEVDELLGSQTKEALTNKYETHQELVKNLLLLSKNNQKIYEKEQRLSQDHSSTEENSKDISLSNDEAINWVKEVLYMKHNVTNESVDNLVYTPENDQSDGLLYIRVNMPQSDTIGVFRITEDGVLEVNGPITGQPLINSKWQIISKQYMDKETAKEYFDNRQ